MGRRGGRAEVLVLLAAFRKPRILAFAAVLTLGALVWPPAASAADSTVLIKNISVNEGKSGTRPATFTLTRSGHSSTDVPVHYTTIDGTATSPSDYVSAQGDVTVPATGSVQVTILVVGDKTPEPDETFDISVVPKAGTIGDGRGTATIVNDDGPMPTPTPKTTPAPVKAPSVPVASSVPSRPSTKSPVVPSPPNAAATMGNPTPATHAIAAAGSTGPTFSVTTASGATSGPVGTGLVLHGERWTGCAQVVVSLGARRLGIAPVDAHGAFGSNELSVPGDTKPGATTLTATCGSSIAKATFRVVYASEHRSAFATSMHTLAQISFSPKAVAASLIPILILTLILGFVTELFNSTYEENHDEIRGWFRRGEKKEKKERTRLQRGVMFFAIVVVGAVLCAFVTPDIGFSLSTVGVLIGMCVALVIVTIGFDVPESIVSHRWFHEAGEITAMPSTIIVAAICVIASRAVHFEPGLLYGLLAVLTFRREFGDKLEGKLGAIACAGILVVSIGSWLALGPVSAAARNSSNFWIITLEATLGAICLLGLESLTFVLMPVRFMMGPKIKEWNKTVWFVLFIASAGMYVHVLLRPGLGYVGSNSVVSLSVLIFAVVPVIGSVAFWSYFRLRPERAEIVELGTELETEPDNDDDDFAFSA
jgi:hypothetical protein